MRGLANGGFYAPHLPKDCFCCPGHSCRRPRARRGGSPLAQPLTEVGSHEQCTWNDVSQHLVRKAVGQVFLVTGYKAEPRGLVLTRDIERFITCNTCYSLPYAGAADKDWIFLVHTPVLTPSCV